MKSDPVPGIAAATPGALATTGAATCESCGKPFWMHDKQRVYADDGPSGSYHYRYRCPGGFGRDALAGLASAGGP